MADNQDTAWCRFYVEPRENKGRSEAEGRPIFDDVEMIEIRVPGDKLTVFHDRVFRSDGRTRNGAIPGGPQSYIDRFPRQYEAFKAKQRQAQSGTPLEHYPPLKASRVAELKTFNIYSCEDYANIPDNVLGKLGMNARKERDEVRAWLGRAQEVVLESKMRAENDGLRAQMQAMEERMQALIASMSAPKTPPEPAEKPIEECTDEELKAFIKRETGEGVRGNPSRETLVSRARTIAEAQRDAAE